MKSFLTILAFSLSLSSAFADEVCGPSANGVTLRFSSVQDLFGMGMASVQIFEDDVLIESKRVVAMGVSASTVVSTNPRRRVRSVTVESALSYGGTFTSMNVVSTEGRTKVILGQEEISCEVVE